MIHLAVTQVVNVAKNHVHGSVDIHHIRAGGVRVRGNPSVRVNEALKAISGHRVLS